MDICVEKIESFKRVSEEGIKSCRFYVNYKKDEFFNYERIYLSQSDGPFLKMQFMEIDNYLRAYYDFTGYITFKDYLKKVDSKELNFQAEIENKEFLLPELLMGLKKLLIGLNEAEDFLLFLDRYIVKLSDIYINVSGGEVKFAYIPIGIKVDKNNKIIELLKEIELEFPKINVSFAISRIIRFLELESPTLMALVNFIGKNIREN